MKVTLGRLCCSRMSTARKERKIQKRLQVHNTEMKMTNVSTVQVASLNDKRYYFSDGIVSLPYGHLLLWKVHKAKKAFPKIHHVIEQEKNKLIRLENKAVARNERLQILRSIYAQPITYYKLNSNKKFRPNIFIGGFATTTTRNDILNSSCYDSTFIHLHWILTSKFKIMCTMPP